MDWKEHIHSDPAIMGGRPTFKGTRYTVERMLKLVGAGWSAEQIAAEYPGIEPLHVQAAAQFAAFMIADQSYAAIGQVRPA